MCNLHGIVTNAMIPTKRQMPSSFFTVRDGTFQDLIGQATNQCTRLAHHIHIQAFPIPLLYS